MIYNHKSKDLVQDIIFEDFVDLISDIFDEYTSLRRYESIAIYAPSYIIIEILPCLLDFKGTYLHAESENLLVYKDKNVLVTLGSNGAIFVEGIKAKDGNIVSNEEITLTYYCDELSHKDLDLLSKNGESILVFGFSDDCTLYNDLLDSYEENEHNEVLLVFQMQ